MKYLTTAIGTWTILSIALHSLAADTVFVTATTDSGPGSLRAAVEKANKNETETIIRFNIPKTDKGFDAARQTAVIDLLTPLPHFAKPGIVIDGFREAPERSLNRPIRPAVELRAGKSGIDFALCVPVPRCTVRGLAVGGFNTGILLYGKYAYENDVDGCRIGTDVEGVKAIPNVHGILCLDGACRNTIRRSLVSGNYGTGILFSGKETQENRIIACRIGTDETGTKRIPNNIGVMASRSSGNIIGEDVDDLEAGRRGEKNGNLISGNDDIGILLVGKWTERNKIAGNLIGTDRTGTKALWNDKGIVLKSLANRNVIGGAKPTFRNVISGNIEIGIYIEAANDNRILGNYIGTDPTGTKIPTDGEIVQGNGIEFNTVAKRNILGGEKPGERNIVSGHKVYGVVYYGHCTENTTIGNYIGTDAGGRSALPNATGICVDCASHHNDIAFNLISGNMSYGMFFVTRGTVGNTLRGNLIGTDVTGKKPLPNDIGMVVSTGCSENLIGGTKPKDANVISGNTQSGIMITNRLTRENVVQGNFIGTDRTGKIAIPNRFGVLFSTYPEKNRIENNVIASNRDGGVVLYEYALENHVTDNIVRNNGAGIVLDRHADRNVVKGNTLEGNVSIQTAVMPLSGKNNEVQQ